MSEIKVNSIKGVAASAAAISVDNSNGTCTLASGSKLNNCTTDGTTNLTIADGNLVMGTGGHGIDFSATSDVTGSTAELLDDYEEGVHQVTLTCTTSGSITLNTSYDTVAYHKIGNWINVHGRVRVSSVSSPSGQQLRVSLPYQSASLSEDAGRVYGVAMIENADQNMINYGIQPTNGGNTFVQVGNINTNTTNPGDVCSQVNSNSLVAINISYRTV
tara:strand:- start:368 stop:1018 length:651 start_codon:yes stop_codon:yes gene_type:complete